MRRDLVYLCGGINGLRDADAKDWREAAKSLLLLSTLDPMRRDYRGKELQNAKEIVESDLEDIRTSKYLLVNATRPSWGTAMEVFYAYRDGAVVVAFTGDSTLSPWLAYHSHAIVKTLEEACALINAKRSPARNNPFDVVEV